MFRAAIWSSWFSWLRCSIGLFLFLVVLAPHYSNVAFYTQDCFACLYAMFILHYSPWFSQDHGFDPPCGSHQLPVLGRFKRQTLHVPNLIIRFGTCKVRRLNQLGSADLYSGRPAVLFGRACRIQRQKIDFVSYVELWHVPNLMHTLQVH